MSNGGKWLVAVVACAALALSTGCQNDSGGGAADAAPGAGGGNGNGSGGSAPVGATPAGGGDQTGGVPDDGQGNGGEAATGGTGGDDPPPVGGGVNPPEPCDGVRLQFGEACDAAADCCAPGLGCADPLGQGAICLNTCDANAPATGCGERELCSPENPDVPGDQASPGICIPGQDCEPGNEELACGGPATCGNFENATFCFPPGEVAVGEQCGLSEDPTTNCEAGLVCPIMFVTGADRCREPCGEEGACAEGFNCVDWTERQDGVPYAFCHDGCSVYGQDCEGEGELCILSDGYEGAAMGACLAQDGLEDGDGVSNDSCDPNGGSGYWATCTAAHLCIDLGSAEAPDPTCTGFCGPDDNSLCINGSVCVTDALIIDVGICLGECNVFGEDTGCGDGQVCSFRGIGAEAGNDKPWGACGPGEQSKATGEACTLNEMTGEHDCVNGHLCTALTQGGGTQCVRLCEAADDSDNTCPPGFECQTGLFGGDQQGVGASERIGACLEPQGGG
jgi:hypothetical protein